MRQARRPAPRPRRWSGHNLVYNGDFAKGPRSLPWNGELSKPAAGRTFVDKGELCLEVTNRGLNRWDAQLRHQHIKLEKGHTYTIQFKVRSTQKTRVYLKLGQAGPPYREFWKLLFGAEEKPQTYSGTFTMDAPDDPGVEMAFHMGGQLARLTPAPFTVCLDDVRVDDPQYTEVPEPVPPPIPNVLVNQVGYFPGLAKIATVKNPNAVPWELLDAKGEVVAKGTTIPFGADAASGDKVSVVDFTAYAGKGTGYTLRVGGDVSHPFDIRDDLYGKLKYDALAFFYQQRSGIPIEMPYAGNEQWVRPAGHIDVKPNIGDTSVPCAPGSGCTYKLDVSGGWYDAGDQGKYVVNAGISVWTLLNWWEREPRRSAARPTSLDGKMNIPENKNKVPDILDEARWELEFELKMQVPEGEKLAGMAHHKIHDAKWTQLSLGPHEDPMPRFLQPPSTAATLNLAANAAQCGAHLEEDRQGVRRQVPGKAAERAWAAAKANPADLRARSAATAAGRTTTTTWPTTSTGRRRSSTSRPRSPSTRTSSPSRSSSRASTPTGSDNSGMHTSMTWGDTQSLGSISLAIVPNGLGKDGRRGDPQERRRRRPTSTWTWSTRRATACRSASPAKGYPWGSNSFVLTNAMMLGLAYDFTKDGKYLNGVAMGMDYVLGRNAIDQSFVTGWGERPLENPYHRFWCHQANPKYPPPPPGHLVGRAELGLRRSVHGVGGPHAAARRRSASSTTARRGQPTR